MNTSCSDDTIPANDDIPVKNQWCYEFILRYRYHRLRGLDITQKGRGILLFRTFCVNITSDGDETVLHVPPTGVAVTIPKFPRQSLTNETALAATVGQPSLGKWLDFSSLPGAVGK